MPGNIMTRPGGNGAARPQHRGGIEDLKVRTDLPPDAKEALTEAAKSLNAKMLHRRLQFANFADMGFEGALLTLVKGIIGHRQMVVLFGDSGSAKSLIALSMGMHIALGQAFCNRKS